MKREEGQPPIPVNPAYTGASHWCYIQRPDINTTVYSRSSFYTSLGIAQSDIKFWRHSSGLVMMFTNFSTLSTLRVISQRLNASTSVLLWLVQSNYVVNCDSPANVTCHRISISSPNHFTLNRHLQFFKLTTNYSRSLYGETVCFHQLMVPKLTLWLLNSS